MARWKRGKEGKRRGNWREKEKGARFAPTDEVHWNLGFL